MITWAMAHLAHSGLVHMHAHVMIVKAILTNVAITFKPQTCTISGYTCVFRHCQASVPYTFTNNDLFLCL